MVVNLRRMRNCKFHRKISDNNAGFRIQAKLILLGMKSMNSFMICKITLHNCV